MSTAITKLAKEWGIPIVDAKDPIIIHVDSQDVVGATCNDPTNCVFARACKRQMGAEKVFIFRTTATIYFAAHKRKPARLVRYILPLDAQKAIRTFDETKGFTAATFRFDPPSKSQTLGACRARTAKRPGRHETGDGKIKRTAVRVTSTIRINTLRMRVA